MARKTPPVPSANQSDKGPKPDGRSSAAAETGGTKARRQADTAGRTGQEENIRQNTTNQGLQQDR